MLISTSALSFLLAVMVLQLADLRLGRGDALGVSGAMIATAVMVLGYPAALVTGITGTALVTALTRQHSDTRALSEMAGLAGGLLGGLAGLGVARALIGDLWRAGAVPATLPVVTMYLIFELAAIQFALGRRPRTVLNLIVGDIRLQGPMLVAQASACLLGVIVFPVMANWGLLLVIALLMLIRQSYLLLLGIRDTYTQTIGLLVQSAELADSRWSGHAARTAQVAHQIATACCLPIEIVDAIGVAALLQDIDTIGHVSDPAGSARPSRVIEDVQSLDAATRILRVLEGGDARRSKDRLAAYIVSLASDIDAAATESLRDVYAVRTPRLSTAISATEKARVVGAAIRLGLNTPAIS